MKDDKNYNDSELIKSRIGLIFYFILGSVMSFYAYLSGLSGFQLIWVIWTWVFALISALSLFYSAKLSGINGNKTLKFALYFPAFLQIIETYARVSLIEYRFLDFSAFARDLIYFSLSMFDLTIYSFIAYFSYVALEKRINYSENLLNNKNEEQIENNKPSLKNETLDLSKNNFPFGKQKEYKDTVIGSILDRANLAERAAKFSLTIMLILVFTGGMASFGLWMFTHADRINTLEAERNKLVKLQSQLNSIQQNLPNQDPEVKKQLATLLERINTDYPQTATYDETIKQLISQSQTNIPDIAIRVTIAVLTIFLVQMFFSIYKYNRHLSTFLSTKAEALVLISEDEEARKKLRLEAVNIINIATPQFGSSPKTPVEDALNIIEKLKK